MGDVKKDNKPRRLPFEPYPKQGGAGREKILQKARKDRAAGKPISPILEAILNEEDEDKRWGKELKKRK